MPIIKKYRQRALQQNLPKESFKTLIDLDGDTVVVPTFWEFVQFILDEAERRGVAELDEHWRPIVRTCGLCDYDYDFVIKAENPNEHFGLAQALGFPFDTSK